MKLGSRLERVVVVPRNGYVNRLQAWASSSIIADRFGLRLEVAWEHESVAPARPGDLFAQALINESFVASDGLTELLGKPHQDMNRYLTVDSDRGVVFLAGHDRGEQCFMRELERVLSTRSDLTTVVIVAGGKFHLSGEGNFASQRREFYSAIQWHPTIEKRVHDSFAVDRRYLGLHIRKTDRSREAPTSRALQNAMKELADNTGVASIFIAADSSSARAEWAERAAGLGLAPWSSDSTSYDREDEAAGVDAIVDWLLLGKSQALVYSRSSSFGEEAALMSGAPWLSRALTAPWGLRTLRDANRLMGSATAKLSSSRF